MQTQPTKDENDLADGKVARCLSDNSNSNQRQGSAVQQNYDPCPAPTSQGDSDLAQQKINDQTHVIELIAKHIAECERLEKKRYQSAVSELGGGAGGGESARLGVIKGDEEEGAELLEPIDSEVPLSPPKSGRRF